MKVAIPLCQNMKPKKKREVLHTVPIAKKEVKTVDIRSVKLIYKGIVSIGWSIITEGGINEKEFKAMKVATPVSEGWLFTKDKDTVKNFCVGMMLRHDGSIHFSERSVFPTSCVEAR